jgi:hypothetical protein
MTSLREVVTYIRVPGNCSWLVLPLLNDCDAQSDRKPDVLNSSPDDCSPQIQVILPGTIVRIGELYLSNYSDIYISLDTQIPGLWFISVALLGFVLSAGHFGKYPKCGCARGTCHVGQKLRQPGHDPVHRNTVGKWWWIIWGICFALPGGIIVALPAMKDGISCSDARSDAVIGTLMLTWGVILSSLVSTHT